MPQFLVSPEHISEDTFSIDGDEARHLIKVLRVQPNDSIQLFDGTGAIYYGTITEITKGSLKGMITKKEQLPDDTRPVTLYIALVMKDRFELILEKATELGVSDIIPLTTARTNIKLPRLEHKLKRWQDIMRSAAKQSMRSRIPVLHKPESFSNIIATLTSSDLNLLAHMAAEKPLNDILASFTGTDSINVFIGPEGGFSDDEVRLALDHNCIPFTMGTTVLRTETAAIVACGIIRCSTR